MTSPNSEDLIRYDVLVQEALRGVVRKVLQEVVKTGLPGQHHFLIAFDTRHPGVRLSTRMRQRYPEEMTIVLQHQFWDLAVTEHAVEVGLSFGGVPERLLIPFTAIQGFFDPSVQFGLQFETRSAADDEDEDESPSAEIAPLRPVAGPKAVPTPAKGKKAAPKDKAKPAEAVPALEAKPAPGAKGGKAEASKADSGKAEPSKAEPAKTGPSKAEAAKPDAAPDETPAGTDAADAAGATVISMDAFRRKS